MRENGGKNETKDGAAFKVEVVISPIDVIANSLVEMGEAYETMEEDADVIAEKFLDIMNQHKANLGYLSDKTVTVSVKEDSEGLWGISDDDFYALDECVLPYE